MRITQFHHATESFGQTGFHIHHKITALLCRSLVETGQLVHFLHVYLEGFANLGCSLVRSQIVIAFAHTQTSLAGVHGVHVAIHLVGSDTGSQIAGDTSALQRAEQGIYVFLVFQSGDFLQFGFNGGNAFLVQFHTVHGNLIQVAHLLSHTAGFVLTGSQFFDKSLNLFAVVFGQHSERAILRILVGQRIVLYPTTTSITVKVGARQIGCVKIGKIDAGCQCSRLLARVAGCECYAQGCNRKIILEIHCFIILIKRFHQSDI